MPVTLFLSTDTGAPTVARTAGQLTTLLDQCLVLQQMQSYNGASYVDNATEARLLAGSAFALLPTGASGDIAYFGGQQKFAQIILKFGTPGVGGTFVFEYWNGSAWTALISPTDGTSGLTANGSLTWSIANQTGWVTTTVNSLTAFWVRIRSTGSTPSTNPLCNSASIYGWNVAYSGTSGRTYQSQITSGVQHWFTINDNGPGAATGQEARIWGNESDPGAYQTGPTASPQCCPTTALRANGIFIRKSNASDTAKVWWVFMDEKSVYVGIQSLDVALHYMTFGFGEIFSLTSGDLYRSFVAARLTENSALESSGLCPLGFRASQTSGISGSVTTSTFFLMRTYLGTGSAVQAPTLYGMPYCLVGSAGVGNIGNGAFNGPDGGIFVAPIFLGENITGAQGHVRGRLRGLWDWGHTVATANDGDIFPGNGALASKTFREFKVVEYIDGSGNANAAVLVGETSDTWETN